MRAKRLVVMTRCLSLDLTKMPPLIFLVFCLCFVNFGESFDCKDENNQAVDWFVMYKLSKMDRTSLPLAKSGSIYVYITSASVASGWQLTTKGVDSSTSMLANTLSPLYDRNTLLQSASILYNDNTPYVTASRGDKGHTKGVLMANDRSAFWLVHSVPSFPDISQNVYKFPDSGKVYAQSFLCLSVNADQVETIFHQFTFNNIIPYDYYVNPSLHQQYPSMTLNIKSPRKAPFNNKATITTKGGVQFTSFAKTAKWGKDLYEWVGDQLGTSLLVQTWRHGTGKLGNKCHGNHIYNIASVSINVNDLSFSMVNNEDHSKWAVTNSKGRPWLCIGDVNRATTQYNRGGGTVCIKSLQLWEAWRNIVNAVEQCPGTG